MKTAAYNPETLTFVSEGAATDLRIIRTEADLAEVQTKDLVSLYNSAAESPVARFTSRAVAESRLMKLIESDRVPAYEIPQAEELRQPDTPTADEPKTKKFKGGKEPAAYRIVKYFKAHPEGATLEILAKEMGITEGTAKAYFRWIATHPDDFGGNFSFVLDRATKIYTMSEAK